MVDIITDRATEMEELTLDSGLSDFMCKSICPVVLLFSLIFKILN